MRNEQREMRNKMRPGTGIVLLAVSVFLISFFLCTPTLPALDSVPAATSAEEVHEDKIIKAIEVRGLTHIDDEELIDLIFFGVGDRLSRDELSKGIRRAFKKGIFLDIKALSEPYGDGVKLTYIVEEFPLVRKITVKGNEMYSDRAIREIFVMKEDETYREDLMDAARTGLLEFYGRKGFAGTEVDISVEASDKKGWVDILIQVEEGTPVIINKIEASIEVRYLLSLTEGDRIDRDKLDKDMAAIVKHYKEKNYVSPSAGPYSFKEGILRMPVSRGTRLELDFKGNTVFSDKKLREKLTFIENEDVSDVTITEAADRIKRRYISNGYYHANVAAVVTRKDEVIGIKFVIYEGEKVVLRKILLSGITINPETLIKTMPLKEDKPFNNNLLSDGRESIIRFYNALGYLRADVLEIKKELRNEGKDMALEFVIKEGQQTVISSIDIKGNKKLDESQIRKALKLENGSPYNVIDIGDARRRVLSLYRRHGYLNTRIEVESKIKADRASLTFGIEEHKPSIVGKIILRGNQKTKAKIIKREFNVEEGSLYNSDTIAKIRRRLYKLGIFSEVSIEIIEPGTEKDGEVVKDMLVSLKESKAGSVEVSIGYGDYERLRGSFDVSYRNIGGYNRRAGFRTEISEVEQRYIFSFREPWLFNKPDVPLKVFLIREKKRSLNIETRDVLYNIDKQSFIAGIEKELTEGLKAGFNYEYSFVDTKDVDEGVILSKEDTGTLEISSISPSVFYDTRDNPFDPTSGNLQVFVVKYASKAFLSETEFIKGTFKSSWFVKLFKPLVLAFSLGGGAAYGFDETEELPLIERFFLGGRTTVRGYRHDTLGPKGSTGEATGGNMFAITNWELRISIFKGFGLVTFLDAGNVWRTADEVDDELKYTIGTGLRYNTLVGPVRIDYGHKMNKESGDSSGEVHFSFGHAF